MDRRYQSRNVGAKNLYQTPSIRYQPTASFILVLIGLEKNGPPSSTLLRSATLYTLSANKEDELSTHPREYRRWGQVHLRNETRRHLPDTLQCTYRKSPSRKPR
jgi:hypothetical protein